MIELRKVRHVIEIARHGGFAKAADALHITQSALTKSVQSVEGRLGLRLLERGPKGVTLTPEGERFVRRGGRLLAEAEELELDARAVAAMEVGRLRIGAAPAALDILFMNSLPGFVAAFPGIRVETVADAVEHVVRLLLNGELDFAIGAFEGLRDSRDVDIERIASLPVELFVRRGHPLDSDTPPDLEAVLAYPWVGPQIPEPQGALLRRWAVQFNTRYAVPQIVVDAFPTIQRIVSETDAVAVVLASHAREGAFARRFRSWPEWQPLPALDISVLSRAGWEPSRAARKLLESIRRM